MAAISTLDVLAADEDIGVGVVICIGLWVCLGLALSATITSKPCSTKENDLGALRDKMPYKEFRQMQISSGYVWLALLLLLQPHRASANEQSYGKRILPLN